MSPEFVSLTTKSWELEGLQPLLCHNFQSETSKTGQNHKSWRHMLKMFISSVREGLSTTRTSPKKHLAKMVDFRHGGVCCMAASIVSWVCFQIVKRLFIWKAQKTDIKYSKWHMQIILNVLFWNVKTDFREFLQAKLLQAKVLFSLANVQLTTLSVVPWRISIYFRGECSFKDHGSCKLWSNLMGIAVLFILAVICVLQSQLFFTKQFHSLDFCKAKKV